MFRRVLALAIAVSLGALPAYADHVPDGKATVASAADGDTIRVRARDDQVYPVC